MPIPYGTPKQWLIYAESDLALAGIERHPKILLDTLCFHAQQSVEKSIKAVLILHNIDFPYTHDIGLLIKKLKESEIAWPEEWNRAAILSKYAWMSRYPSDIMATTMENYQEAINLAQAVFAWATKIISAEPTNQGETSS